MGMDAEVFAFRERSRERRCLYEKTIAGRADVRLYAEESVLRGTVRIRRGGGNTIKLRKATEFRKRLGCFFKKRLKKV